MTRADKTGIIMICYYIPPYTSYIYIGLPVIFSPRDDNAVCVAGVFLDDDLDPLVTFPVFICLLKDFGAGDFRMFVSVTW
jgi:hypothetical protein